MFAILIALFIVVPLIEITVIIQVGQHLGAVNTLGLLLLISVVGAWVVKRQGLGALRRIRQETAAGQVPGTALLDGALILVAGVLLLTPGFVTDAVGLLLLLPPVRAGIRVWIRRRLVLRVDLIRAARTSRPPAGPQYRPPEPPRSLPS